MSALAAIHVAKKQLGLDEDTYRALLVRVTGKSSTRAMSTVEQNRVVEEFRQRGFKPAFKGKRKPLEGQYAPKLQALWIAAWNLGIVRSRDDKALIAFVKRQTGLEHVRFLHYQEDAMKAIEALKGWIAREANLYWNTSKYAEAHTNLPEFRIAQAQAKFLGVHLQGWVRQTKDDRPGRPIFLRQLEFRDWIAIMNALGELVRAKKAQPRP